MQIASLIHQYHDAFSAKYGSRLLPGHLRAIDAISRCRTPEAGELFVQCTDCGYATWRPRSCGHRSCPQCQNHEASLWLDRQQAKLLPVEYFMVTFTLPYELRALARHKQKIVYNLLFASVSGTLKDFGLNPKNLGAHIGMTAILHTHNRRLDYHPHIHVVVPGGGVKEARKQWIKKKGIPVQCIRPGIGLSCPIPGGLEKSGTLRTRFIAPQMGCRLYPRRKRSARFEISVTVSIPGRHP